MLDLYLALCFGSVFVLAKTILVCFGCGLRCGFKRKIIKIAKIIEFGPVFVLSVINLNNISFYSFLVSFDHLTKLFSPSLSQKVALSEVAG